MKWDSSKCGETWNPVTLYFSVPPHPAYAKYRQNMLNYSLILEKIHLGNNLIAIIAYSPTSRPIKKDLVSRNVSN